VFARLSEYIDGELPEGDCAEIEEHIADCPPCIEFLRNLRRSVAASRDVQSDLRPGPIPDEIQARLRAAWSQALTRRGE
jgi:RNA polymerase sigma-70 factor (ECF subfamily)